MYHHLSLTLADGYVHQIEIDTLALEAFKKLVAGPTENVFFGFNTPAPAVVLVYLPGVAALRHTPAPPYRRRPRQVVPRLMACLADGAAQSFCLQAALNPLPDMLGGLLGGVERLATTGPDGPFWPTLLTYQAADGAISALATRSLRLLEVRFEQRARLDTVAQQPGEFFDEHYSDGAYNGTWRAQVWARSALVSAEMVGQTWFGGVEFWPEQEDFVFSFPAGQLWPARRLAARHAVMQLHARTQAAGEGDFRTDLQLAEMELSR